MLHLMAHHFPACIQIYAGFLLMLSSSRRIWYCNKWNMKSQLCLLHRVYPCLPGDQTHHFIRENGTPAWNPTWQGNSKPSNWPSLAVCHCKLRYDTAPFRSVMYHLNGSSLKEVIDHCVTTPELLKGSDAAWLLPLAPWAGTFFFHAFHT